MYAISPATDENGAKVELKRENISGLTVYVLDKCLPFGPSLNLFFFIWQAPKAVQNTIDFTIEGYGKPYSCLEGWCILRLMSGKYFSIWIVFKVYEFSPCTCVVLSKYLQLKFWWRKKANYQQRLCLLWWPWLRLLKINLQAQQAQKIKGPAKFFSPVKASYA